MPTLIAGTRIVQSWRTTKFTDGDPDSQIEVTFVPNQMWDMRCRQTHRPYRMAPLLGRRPQGRSVLEYLLDRSDSHIAYPAFCGRRTVGLAAQPAMRTDSRLARPWMLDSGARVAGAI